MYYITMRRNPSYHQMSLDEFLNSPMGFSNRIVSNLNSTTTYTTEVINKELLKTVNVQKLISKLTEFNKMFYELKKKDRHSLYNEFHIPKKSGGLRKIDAPNEELKSALYVLKAIFEEDFHALNHTSAFAYVKSRSTIDAVNRHVNNKSEWYCKLDLHNFFGSTTKEFVMNQLSIIFPFCEVCRTEEGYRELESAVDLAFLDNGLPQGTPISPLITNIMMIPVDHILSNKLRDYDGNHFIYTRYADDFIISSRKNFDVRKIISVIDDTLKSFNAPFRIKPEKTRYGSAAGRNWTLGVMVTKNENGDIIKTIGSKKKRQFEAMLSSFVLDTKSGKNWSYEDIMILDGYRNYYIMVEGDSINRIVDHIGAKYNVDIAKMIHEQKNYVRQ